MGFKLKFAQELQIDLPDGSSFNMQEPSAEACSEYFKTVKELEDKPEELLQAAKDFIHELGCPEKVSSQLSFYGIRDLVEFLLGEKKS